MSRSSMFACQSTSVVRCLLFSLAFALPLSAQTTPAPKTDTAARQTDKDLETAELDKALAMAAFGYDAGSKTAEATTNDAGPLGIIPFAKGFNVSLGTTSQHDSAAGFFSILTPNVAFRFNRHFSANVGLPVYAYASVYDVISTKSATKTTPAVAIYGFRSDNFLLGDTDFAFEYETHLRHLDYNITTTLGVPTGNDANALGAGQVTYNFNNHFERPLRWWVSPDIELGLGNSPNLVDSRVRKSYIDVGTNAHFQAGFNFQLPYNCSFTTDAFEELPLTTQTVTSITTNGKKGTALKTFTTTTSHSVGEDNGFINSLDIPLTAHVTLSGFYNRSLRNKIDTAGFSFTFLLKAARGSEPVH